MSKEFVIKNGLLVQGGNTNQITGSLMVSTFVNSPRFIGEFTGSLYGTASYWNSSSVVAILNNKQWQIDTGSMLPVTSSQAISASYAVNAENTLISGSNYDITASQATSASYSPVEPDYSASVASMFVVKTGDTMTGALTAPAFTGSLTATNVSASMVSASSGIVSKLVVRGPTPAPYYSQIHVQPATANQDTAVMLESNRLSTTQRWFFGCGSGATPNTNNFRIYDLTIGADRFNIASGSGYVGVGRTDPVSLLSLGTGSITMPAINTNGFVMTGGPSFTSTGGSNGKILFPATGNIDTVSDLYFRDGTNTWMTIKPTGYVGIGNVTPQAKLHVQGNISCSNLIGTASYATSWLGSIAYTSNANATDYNWDRTIFIPEYHSLLYAADKRFVVSASVVSGSGWLTYTPELLFNSKYEEVGNRIQSGSIVKLNIDLTGRNEVSAIIYPYGYLYLTFYYDRQPSGIQGRIKRNDGTWFPMTNTGNLGNQYFGLYRLSYDYFNYATEIEVTITSSATVESWLQEIEWWNRRTGNSMECTVRKSVPNTVYGNLTFNNAVNSASVVIRTTGQCNATGWTSSLFGTASFANMARSSSYALTASYAVVTQVTQSVGSVVSASWASSSISASYTAYAGNATSASYALSATNAVNATYATVAVSSNTANTAALADTATNAVYADSAVTASHSINGITASYAHHSNTSEEAIFADEAGSATTATNATSASYASSADSANATRLFVDTTAFAGTFHPLMVAAVGGMVDVYADSDAAFTYNPSTNTLTVPSMMGTASQAISSSYWNSSSIAVILNNKQWNLETGSTIPITSSCAVSASWSPTQGSVTSASYAIFADTSKTSSYWDSSSVATILNNKQNNIATGSTLPITASHATKATFVSVNNDTGNTNQYLWTSNDTSGLLSPETAGDITINPTTKILTATSSWSTNAATANNANYVGTTNDVSTNGERYPLFAADAASTYQAVYGSKTKLIYNPSNGSLTASKFNGNLQGTASQATNAYNAANADYATYSGYAETVSTYINGDNSNQSVPFVATTTGNNELLTDTNFYYNPSFNILTVPTVEGNLNGTANTASYVLNTNIEGPNADSIAAFGTNKKMTTVAVTKTELGYVAGVTSAIQTQLNNKQAKIATGSNMPVTASWATNLVGGGSSNVKAGTADIVNDFVGGDVSTPWTYSVVFGTAYGDTNYAITLAAGTGFGGGWGNANGWRWQNKATTGFDIILPATGGLPPGNVDWVTTPYANS